MRNLYFICDTIFNSIKHQVMSLKEFLTKCRPCPLIVIEKHGNYFNGVLTLVRRQIMVVQSHFVKSTEFMI